jgi:hypothetical protein
LGGLSKISVSALSTESLESTGLLSVFQSSNKPPTSSPMLLGGGPSDITADFPSLLWPVTIRLNLYSRLRNITNQTAN